ncbi:MAG: DUF3309 family protein [Planctomycetota bacterium]|nr:DUF3309 family protein [Planctomycetota bacterium]
MSVLLNPALEPPHRKRPFAYRPAGGMGLLLLILLLLLIFNVIPFNW